jgi:hypothetical protein
MAPFYRIKETGQLMCVTERVPAGPVGFMLKGFVQGVGPVTMRKESECEPMPGAPMPRLRVVSAGDE